MKTKCTQCGKIFSVPDGQVNRAIKCACKNIFVAKAFDDGKKSEVKEDVEVFKEEGVTSKNIDSVEQDVNDPNLDHYVSFLRQSKPQMKVSESSEFVELTPIKSNPIEEIEVSQPSISRGKETLAEPADAGDAELEETVTSRLNHNQKSQPSTQAAPQSPSKSRLSAGKETIKIKYPVPRPPIMHDPRKIYALAGAGVVAIILLVFAISSKPSEQIVEQNDPYLQQLLTKKSSNAVQSANTSPKVQPAPSLKLPEPRKMAETKAELDQKPAVKSPVILDNLLEATFEGNFENVIRIASTSKNLDDEEKAVFLEALFARAGAQINRHADLMDQLHKYRSEYPDSSALMRAKAVGILKNPSENKNLNQALEILRSLSLTRSRDPLVFTYLGFVFQELDRLDLAHQAWDQALTIQRDFVWLLQVRDHFYRDEEKFDRAMKMATALNKIPGHEADGLKRQAEIAYLMKDIPSAVAFYQKAQRHEDSAELRLAAGRIQMESNSAAAIREFEIALQRKPSPLQKRDILIELGRTHCHKKNYEAASAAFKRAFSEDPNSILIAIEKSNCDLEAGRYNSAAATLEKALKLNPNNAQLWYNYGFALYRQDKQRPSLAALKRSLELRDSDQSHVMLAQVFIGMKKKQEAGQHLKKALQLNPKNKTAKQMLRTLN